MGTTRPPHLRVQGLGWWTLGRVVVLVLVPGPVLVLVALRKMHLLRMVHAFPLLDDFEDDFSLAHAGELVLVLVVELPRELPVHSAQVLPQHLPPLHF